MSVTAPRGFIATGGHVGIKPEGAADCAVVLCTTDSPASTAAVFTTNLAAAAPVVVSRAHLAATQGRLRGVVVTSGNANAATGARGIVSAEGLCITVGDYLGATADEVVVAQTGLIGVTFEFERTFGALAALCGGAASTLEAANAAATAILTTDTRTKTHVVRVGDVTVGAMAKGAAMLAPNMATMLAVITTDAQIEPRELDELLRAAVGPTFNSLHVDGATSTNDTVFALASGLGGAVDRDALAAALHETCASLARQMAEDAEGATKTATVTVEHAASDYEAHQAARAVAGSLLVKCSLNGADPYWGRIVSELGSAGVTFELDRTRVGYGDVVVCEQGEGVAHDEAALRAHLQGRHVRVQCDLGLGEGTASVLCCDLGEGYLMENRTTS